MAGGLIPYSSIPSPVPAGMFEDCESALVAAGFSSVVTRAPDGVMVSDVATVTSVINTYVGSPAHMAVLRSAAIDALSNLFAAKIAVGRVYSNGKTYQIDPASQANINAMATRAGLVLTSAPGSVSWPASFYWIATDNTHTSMTVQQMYDFAQNVGDYVSALILNNRALKDQINAAIDPSALAAVNVNSGWPSNP